MPSAGQRMVLADLREQVGRRLNGAAMSHRVTLPFGVPALDRHLPGGGLARGVLHEVVEGGPAAEFAGAATLFAAGIAARLKGPVLWCLTRRDLFAPGLAAAGLHPDRVIYARPPGTATVLPLIEEGLREKGLAAVVGEVTRLGLTASRRLQLAAEASGVPALVLATLVDAGREGTDGSADRRRHALAHRACPFGLLPAPGLGRPRWQVDLLRCRGAEPRSWILEACDAKGRLAVPADLADRPHQAPLRRAAAG